MVPNRSRPSIAVAMALAGALVLAACQPTGGPGTISFRCTPSLGDLPKFTVPGSPFSATRPAAGGVTVVTVPIENVIGAFGYVLWDVLGAEGYDPVPDGLMYFVQDNPTLATASTDVDINVYDWTPVGDYALRVRGLAFEGTFFDDVEDDLVGECFHDFELRVY